MRRLSWFKPLAVMTALAVWLGAVPVYAGTSAVLQEVQDLISEYYVDPVDSGAFSTDTPEAMVEELGDRYSEYMTSGEFLLFIDDFDRRFTGIGIFLQMHEEGVLVLDIIKDSPAEKAGLKAGDIITRAGNTSLQGVSEDEALQVLLGPAGSAVDLEVKRGSSCFTVTVVREDITVPTVSGDILDYSIGYVNLRSFGSETALEMLDILCKLDQQGADRWIIDLRGNPGGYVETAAQVGGLLLDTDNLFVVQEKEQRFEIPAFDTGVQVGGPMLVLIDQDSASASEILAAALKDYQRAVLVGETTYGKGTMQQFFTLSNKDVLKLTVARFYSPYGHEINGVGVKPDIEVARPWILPAAELLLADPVDSKAGFYYFEAGGYRFIVDLTLARTDKYWEAWYDICDGLEYQPVYIPAGRNAELAVLLAGKATGKWTLYYPGYYFLGRYTQANSAFIQLYLARGIKFAPSDSFELINSESGERLDFILTIEEGLVSIKPEQALQPGEYWLVADKQTARLKPGYIAVFNVK